MLPRKPRLACVPFGYPDYPRDDLARMSAASGDALERMGVDVVRVPPVIVADDVEPARRVLRSETYDAIVPVLISWVEAPLLIATLRPFRTRPLLLWSHTTYMDGDSRITLGALPAAGVIRETLEEMGFRFRFVYGMPGEPGLADRFLPFAQAAATAESLTHARVGLFGYASMGMYTGTIDHTQLRSQVGPEIDHLDQYVIVERFNKLTDDDVRGLFPRTESWVLSPAATSADLVRVFRMYAAIKALAQEYRYDALTIKCQYELSRMFGLAPCMPLSLLGDEMVVSCEGDIPLVVSQLILHYLTGETTSYGDFHNVTEREILLAACGFAPLSYAAGRPIVNKHTALYEGLLNSSPYKEGTVTVARLGARGSGGGFKMHIAGGKAVPPPPFHEVGCPPYAYTSVELDGDTDEFVQNLFSQHYAIAYGDVRAALHELCWMLDIAVVN
jgi:L-fucose isomerase-like protein